MQCSNRFAVAVPTQAPKVFYVNWPSCSVLRRLAGFGPATRYSDLGLRERKHTAVASSAPQWCASFRTPSLRNVAVRARFMHNGAFTKLRDVVAFYATRTTAPSRWYPPGAKFDDVPAKYRANVNVSALPYNRAEGDKPALDDEDIDAIVAFLGTLTDRQYLGAAP